MHSVCCPSCGTRVEVDFVPIAGRVWCPKCQKLFSQPGSSDEADEGLWASEEDIDELPPA